MDTANDQVQPSEASAMVTSQVPHGLLQPLGRISLLTRLPLRAGRKRALGAAVLATEPLGPIAAGTGHLGVSQESL